MAGKSNVRRVDEQLAKLKELVTVYHDFSKVQVQLSLALGEFVYDTPTFSFTFIQNGRVVFVNRGRMREFWAQPLTIKKSYRSWPGTLIPPTLLIFFQGQEGLYQRHCVELLHI